MDLFTGWQKQEIYGSDKYAAKLIEVLARDYSKEVLLKIVSYKKYPLPKGEMANMVIAPFQYSLLAMMMKRGGVRHITSQEHAHILNFVSLNPVVVTCHDIIPKLFPPPTSLHRLSSELALRGLHKANRIMADSISTKRDLVKYLKYPEEKVEVVPLGIDHDIFRPRPVKHEVLVKYKIPENRRYILYVGTEDPRKNFFGLVKAFSKIKKDINDIGLIKVGPPHYMGGRSWLLEKIMHFDMQKDVFFTPYISEDELVDFYNLADLFVFPSFYEGFGFPVLEAMACGCPVVASNTSSLPEIVGDAGIMVHPSDIEGLASAMKNVLTHDGMRDEMGKKGLSRAKNFDWKKTARQVVKVYEETA